MTPEQILNRLREAKEVVYDAETSGLSWQRNHVCGHVLSYSANPADSHYVPVRHLLGGNVAGCDVPQTKDGWKGDLHPFEKELVKLLDRPDLTVSFHNGSFDLKFLHRLGLKFKAKYDDTIINQALINEYAPSFTLDSCCKNAGVAQKKTGIYDYLIAKFPEARTAPKQAMGHFWRLAGDDPQAVDYACADGYATWQLREWQLKQIELQELTRVHGVECRLIPVLARMTTRGTKIDEARLDEVTRTVETKIEEARQALPDGFNSRAPTQVRSLMEKNYHLDWPLTAKGAPSFPEQWLLTNPVGKNIVTLRKFENLKASFLVPMKETHLWNGRCHPEYNQLRGDEYGTITGRLSSSNPNLQQVNKRNRELGGLHRSIFVPDEGMVWGSADYSQMEPRLLAWYSRCKVLLDGYRSSPPIDAHLAVAKAVNVLSWDSMTKDEQKDAREIGKRINQTLITGGGKGVLVSKYGVPADKVDSHWSNYFNRLPEIKEMQRRATNRMRERGYVMTVLGRRCRIADKDYVGLNRLLQGSNADCLKLKLVEIDEFLRSEGDKVNLLNNVHDAADFQFRPEDKHLYDRSLEIMSSFGEDDVLKFDLPMVVDHKEGANWAEATWDNE